MSEELTGDLELAAFEGLVDNVAISPPERIAIAQQVIQRLHAQIDELKAALAFKAISCPYDWCHDCEAHERYMRSAMTSPEE